MNSAKLYASIEGITNQLKECNIPLNIRLELEDVKKALLDDIYLSAKVAGKTAALSAARKIIKKGGQYREELSGAWIGADGRQYFCDGYIMIALNDPLPLAQAAGWGAGEQILINAEQNMTPCSIHSFKDLKVAFDLYKEQTKGKKGKDKRVAVYRLNTDGPFINLEKMLDVMKIIGTDGVQVYAGRDNLRPIIFKGRAGSGLVMPIRSSGDSKTVNEIMEELKNVR